MSRVSLRWLLLASVLGAITIGFTCFAFFIDRVEQRSRLDDIDTELVRAERVGLQGRRADRPGPLFENDDVLFEVEDGVVDAGRPVELLIDPGGALVGAGAENPFSPNILELMAEGEGNMTISEPRYRVRRSVNGDGLVSVTALPLDEFDAAVERFRFSLLVGGSAILALVTAVLWAFTGLLARPVTRMAATANRIAAGDLETPVGPPGGSRETADLAVGLDQMMNRLRQALRESNEAREVTERLLADMAHEIRTPLTALKGYSDLYARGMLENQADVDRAMGRIGSESERLSVLADAMLQLAREGSMPENVEEFNLGELVHEVVKDLQVAYPEQRIKIDLGQPNLNELRGSRHRIQQAVLNLGSNACHHNPPGHDIVVSVQSVRNELCLSVADRGPGIAPADRDRIFRPFYRSDGARNRDGQHGAGLGLALVRQIAIEHGGSVSVEATHGGGATFSFSVPRSS